ncbi:MAG: lamin tail domain-containing protein [Candidatus Pacebacteria bacterium]|nr:lamin tail domain-containing protein [Candidatus Paceibacterota bacterium]
MSPAKSVLLAVVIAGVAYGAATVFGGARQSSDSTGAISGALVTVTVSPGATQVTRGDRRGVTSVTPRNVAVTPLLSPAGTSVSPLVPRVSVAVSNAPSATPAPVLSSLPSPIVARTATPTPVVQTPTPVPSATVTPSPAPTPAAPASTAVVINEVAWAGTAANASDEWIELFNYGSSAIDLSGWGLFEGATQIIELKGVIGAGEYWLIERTDDSTVSDIAADVIGPFSGSGLSNSGEALSLRTAMGVSVDIVDCAAEWFNAGLVAQKQTMERKDPRTSGSEATNWGSNSGAITTGLDAKFTPIVGTPKFKNSLAL